MSKKMGWPINKGIFRSPQSDFQQERRSSSPIVEMPISPDPETATNGNPLSPRFERSVSPRRSQSPFNSSMNVREIPIEVEHGISEKKKVRHHQFEFKTL